MIAAAPSGVNHPSSTSSPPTNSPRPAIRALRFSGTEPDRVELRSGPVRTRAAEDAEQLLRTVAHEQETNDQAEDEKTKAHGPVATPAAALQPTTAVRQNSTNMYVHVHRRTELWIRTAIFRSPSPRFPLGSAG